MSRIAKLEAKDWDPQLRRIFAADSATPLEQGAMRMFAHRPAIAKGVVALRPARSRRRAAHPSLVR